MRPQINLFDISMAVGKKHDVILQLELRNL